MTAPAVAVVVALLLAVVAVAWLSGQQALSPDVVAGWAMPNGAGTAISLHASPDDTGNPGEGYVVAGADWAGADGVWHDGAEALTCVGTATGTFTRVELGVVEVESANGVTRPQVVWLRCLD